MLMSEQNDFENKIDIPILGDTDSLPKIVQQISVISDAIEKCEKILQHIAVGNFSDEFQEYMSTHIHLISQRNNLLRKLEVMKDLKDVSSEKIIDINHEGSDQGSKKNRKLIIAISAGAILAIIVAVYFLVRK